MKQGSRPVQSDVRIGYVHLKPADLDRPIAFYHDVLGFQLTQPYGQRVAFLSPGGYQHHVGLNMVTERLDLEALLKKAPDTKHSAG